VYLDWLPKKPKRQTVSHWVLIGQILLFTDPFSVVICIIFGCSVPVVLKKISETNGSGEQCIYQFVGECYVHGMMDGGAIDVQESKKLETMTFEIR